MLQTVLDIFKDSRFQSALVGAFLGAISAFVFTYWGIDIDFGSLQQAPDAVEVPAEPSEQAAEPVETPTETTVETPVEVLEVIAD